MLLSIASSNEHFAHALAHYKTGQLGINELRTQMEKTGVESFARQLAQQLCTNATRSAQFLLLPQAAQDLLASCTTMILERNR